MFHKSVWESVILFILKKEKTELKGHAVFIIKQQNITELQRNSLENTDHHPKNAYTNRKRLFP